MKHALTAIGLGVATLMVGLSAASAANAGSGEVATQLQNLDYFAGSWECAGTATTPDGPVQINGTLSFHPWQAWYISTWEPQDANSTFENPTHWPPHGGHGPVILPPHRPGVTSVPAHAITFEGYDRVTQDFVAFKIVSSGVYAQMSSTGPDARGIWTWSGAISDDGTGKQGISARTVIDTSMQDVFTATYATSPDLGASWTENGSTRCTKIITTDESH